MEHNNEIFLGHRSEWGNETPFGLDVEARRQHVYVIGQTGAGKSTLLRNSILQDIEAGRGVALIDPHGDLAHDVLEQIPPRRTSDVIYFNPADQDPLAINLFRATGNDWHLIASGIVSAFKRIWGESWGPRLEYVLYATLAALLQCENTTLLGVSRMLFDEKYRMWVVRQVKDPMVKSFWTNEFAQYDKNFRQEVISPIQNKVGQLFLSPSLRNVLGQVTNRINFRFIMDNQRIFVANLSKGMIGERHGTLVGSLLVTGFELAALSRADSAPHARRDFFLYADEFQSYATDSFANVLSESRKYGLSLTLAHQYLAQLPDSLKASIFGNIGTFVSFRVGEADAEILARQFGGKFGRELFSSLDDFHLCVKLLNRDPFLGRSLPPLDTARRRANLVIKHSRRRYSIRRQKVEDKLSRWIARRH